MMNDTFKRLAMIADMVIKGEKAADIGADHALLPIYLIENHMVPHVIIGELGDGPYRRACKAVQASSVNNSIDLRQGNGLQVLDYGEVKSVILAGMGGDTMVDILAYDWDKAASFRRFVFQPMTKVQTLRRRLASQGWVIEEERLGLENGRFFQVIASRPANCPYTLTDLEMEIGAAILRADDELKKGFIQLHMQKYKRIYEDLMGSPLHRNRLLAEDYKGKIERLEEILGASQS
ncbi:MAG: class I SAM-dependent methyltransferase [Syntrophomonas sp.]|nr:class I SAM-dependent methyltransferase [Syntrophomonas sp.]